VHTSPRHIPAAALLAAICAAFGCQSSPTGSDEPDGTQNDSLHIAAPATLLVHGTALLSAEIWRVQQKVLGQQITWSTSDPSIASVRPAGGNYASLTALRRGTVAISASAGGAVAEVNLRIAANLRIEPDYVLDSPGGWPMAVGEQLQLRAAYVDANGLDIPEIPAVTWSSTAATGVSVSSSGLVTASQANQRATVTAMNTDDTATVRIHVLDVVAGQPATVRIVHGVSGLGPVRFLVNQGAPLSLSFGQSVELPILSGTLTVTTEGLPPGDPTFGNSSGKFVGTIRPGDHLALYAVGSSEGAFLQPAWPTAASISPESGLVRLIQSSTALVVYLRGTGAPISGLPELCYFDPGVVSDYFVRAAGDFDVIGQEKYESQREIGRTAGSVAGGHAVTLVLTGGGKLPLSVLTFTDR
jgi:hypothetical protein